ncbi:MAG TPA: hypothetical protein VNL98_04180 [Gemmatimonadales bacterium]|nr:hypothetical protein [Gemmatimonadales bacterium]
MHRRAAVGAHLFHWMRSRDSSIAGAITTGLTYYPWSTRRWWLLASGGWSWYSVESDGIGFQAREVVRTDGPGVAVAVGFDLHLDREISLSPSLTWYRGWLPGLRGSRLRSSGLRQDVVSFAMALTFH